MHLHCFALFFFDLLFSLIFVFLFVFLSFVCFSLFVFDFLLFLFFVVFNLICFYMFLFDFIWFIRFYLVGWVAGRLQARRQGGWKLRISWVVAWISWPRTDGSCGPGVRGIRGRPDSFDFSRHASARDASDLIAPRIPPGLYIGIWDLGTGIWDLECRIEDIC